MRADVSGIRIGSLLAQLSLTPAPEWVVILNGMYGAERADDSGDARALLDLLAMWKSKGKVALGLNLDHGSEENAVVPGQNARWDGVAAYVRIHVAEGCSLVGRAERFADWDGARTGVIQRLGDHVDPGVSPGERARDPRRHTS